jgi:hypothetical protein
MADETTWWVIWRQSQPDAVAILWIGPQPGPDAFAYSTETPASLPTPPGMSCAQAHPRPYSIGALAARFETAKSHSRAGWADLMCACVWALGRRAYGPGHRTCTEDRLADDHGKLARPSWLGSAQGN